MLEGQRNVRDNPLGYTLLRVPQLGFILWLAIVYFFHPSFLTQSPTMSLYQEYGQGRRRSNSELGMARSEPLA